MFDWRLYGPVILWVAMMALVTAIMVSSLLK